MIIFLCISALITVSECSTCDLFEEATSLHCLAPLVEYADVSKRVLHPPLSSIDRNCNQYNKYLTCTSGVRPDCRRTRAPRVEGLYELMCEEKYVEIVREETECLVKLERDEFLKACFVNRTNILRDDDRDYDNEVTPTSYECQVLQAYVDCLLERDSDSCGDAVKVEVSLLSLMASNGADCQLQSNSTRNKPPPLEVCAPNGQCHCRLEGYVYNPVTKLCVDVDECASESASTTSELTSGCSQKCQNLPGSFQCSCELDHFHLAENNKTCVRNDKESLWLFFAHGQSIWNISADGKVFQLQRAGLQKTAMIDIDVKERRLYYADIGANSIERMNIDGTFPQIVQRYDVDGLEGIAVDWVGRNLYSLRRNDIMVQSLDGRFRSSVHRGVMRLPRAIAMHPSRGELFVSDWSSNAFIAVAAMDGTYFKTIVTDRLTWPNALTVDQYADKVYWADAFLDVIESCNVDGTGRRIVVGDSGSVPHVFGMAVADDLLYWTDWTYRGLLRANKLTGENITVLAQTALLPYSLKIFHYTLQPNISSPCETKKCSQLCLIGPSVNKGLSATCACGEGFELAADGRSCQSDCSETQIECGGSDPKCISKLFLCDGVPQCSNHADEAHCPPRICLPGQFQCHDNKKCVSPGGLCDGIRDCVDGSDELYCSLKPTPSPSN